MDMYGLTCSFDLHLQVSTNRCFVPHAIITCMKGRHLTNALPDWQEDHAPIMADSKAFIVSSQVASSRC